MVNRLDQSDVNPPLWTVPRMRREILHILRI